jgi:hypothetical protein
VNEAGALPLFVITTDCGGAGDPTSVEANPYVAAPVSHAPFGVAERSTTTFEFKASSVNIAIEPVIGVPGLAVVGTLTDTFIVPDAPGATVRAFGLMLKPAPTSVADTWRGEPPPLLTTIGIAAGIDPQPTEPKLTIEVENDAAGGLTAPPSAASWKVASGPEVASPPSAAPVVPSPEGVASRACASPVGIGTEVSSPAPRQPTRSTLQASAATSDASPVGRLLLNWIHIRPALRRVKFWGSYAMQGPAQRLQQRYIPQVTLRSPN